MKELQINHPNTTQSYQHDPRGSGFFWDRKAQPEKNETPQKVTKPTKPVECWNETTL